MPGWNAVRVCVDRVSDRDVWITNSRHLRRQFAPGDFGTSRWATHLKCYINLASRRKWPSPFYSQCKTTRLALNDQSLRRTSR